MVEQSHRRKGSGGTATPENGGAGDNGQDSLETAVLYRLRRLTAAPLEPGLYVVATPIGNLADITVRALAILSKAAVVVCEDTRQTRKLLSAYGLRKRLDVYHDFSGDADRERIVNYVKAGLTAALVSDAGTPLIADPGYKLVRQFLSERLSVFAIPGPSAVIAALVASGLPSDTFSFGGFLPATEGARKAAIQSMLPHRGTLLFYDTGPRLKRTLEALDRLCPSRQVVIARELTKIHEQTLTGTAAELQSRLGKEAVKGEIVLLLGPAGATKPAVSEIQAALADALKKGSLKEAVESVAKALGVQKKLVYNLALNMERNNNG